MKILKSIVFATIAGTALFATAAGAASSSTQVSTSAASQSISLKKVDLGKGSVAGWLSDSKIIISKPNTNLTITNRTGDKVNPPNIYVKDLDTGKETLLVKSETGVGSVKVSPDRKYIYYVDDDGSSVVNVSTGKVVNVAPASEIRATIYGVAWLDNTHVIYTSMQGDIISVDVNGKSQTLLKTGQAKTNAVDAAGSTIYYSYPSGNNYVMMSYNIKTEESSTLKNVNTVFPSQDGSQVAMVKGQLPVQVPMVNSGALVLTDLKGNVKSTLAKDFISYDLEWSSDSSQMAYYIVSTKEKTNTTNYYVYNVKTGKQTQVSLDKKNFGAGMSWSPSGKKILYITDNGAFMASVS